MTAIYPVILCGGSGTRLWPVSRKAMPKPFLPLVSEETLFEQAVRRVAGDDRFAAPLVVAGPGRASSFGVPPSNQTTRPLNGFLSSGASSVCPCLERTLNPICDPKRETEQDAADIARAFEEAVVNTLSIKCRRALEETGYKKLIIAGGVSANLRLREVLEEAMAKVDGRLFYAQLKYCTDNGAMIAYAGCQRLLAGERDDLEIRAQPRWSLESLAAI